jgi:hypothetical protein
MPPRPQPPEACPVCGEAVPRGSLACPECGADHRSGWKEDAGTHDGLDLPDKDFNYDEFVRDEFGGPSKFTARKAAWWIAAAILLLAALAMACLYVLR